MLLRPSRALEWTYPTTSRARSQPLPQSKRRLRQSPKQTQRWREMPRSLMLVPLTPFIVILAPSHLLVNEPAAIFSLSHTLCKIASIERLNDAVRCVGHSIKHEGRTTQILASRDDPFQATVQIEWMPWNTVQHYG